MAIRPRPRLYQRMASTLVTGPAVEPITLDELKTHLRIDGDADDETIVSLISEARSMIEEYLNIAMINQTWRLTMDHWPAHGAGVYPPTLQSQLAGDPRYVELPRFPLGSVTSVTTYAEDSTATAVTVASVFDVDSYSTPGRLSLMSGQTWPTHGRPTNAIDVVYVAGYGAAKQAVPPMLRRAVLNVAAFMFEHRGDCGSPVSIFMEAGASQMINQFKIIRI